MGLILKFRATPSPRGTDHANDSLATGMHVDVLHGHLLLAVAAMPVQSVEQHDVGARQLIGLDTWADCQTNRDRSAIYAYLTAVYGLVAWWTAEGREVERARRALRSQRLDVSDREDPFAAVIRCTADPAKADKRTRSKWSRVM
jgi:hypothetical protein